MQSARASLQNSLGRHIVALALAVGAAGCSSLLGTDPTPVPGAAATLTRSSRTAIPTPVRTIPPSPAAGAAASRVAIAASPGASPSASSLGVSEEEIARVQQQMEQIVASPDLPGLETLLLDHVSLATPQGGSVLDGGQAAAWLRERATSGINVTRLDPATQTLTLQVFTAGWPHKDPIQQGQVTFSLRRYDASGRLDEVGGDWKIDVIEVE